jgi:hypothetical protein
MKTLNSSKVSFFTAPQDDIAHVEKAIDPKSGSIWLIMRFSLNHRGFQP